MLAKSGNRTPATLTELCRALPGLPATRCWARSLCRYLRLAWRAQRRRPAALPRDGLKRRFGDFLLTRSTRFRPHSRPAAHHRGAASLQVQPARCRTGRIQRALVFACQRGLRQLEDFCAPAHRRSTHSSSPCITSAATRRDAQDGTPSPQPDAAQRRRQAPSPCCFRAPEPYTLERRVERITLTHAIAARRGSHASLLLEEENAARDMRDLLERCMRGWAGGGAAVAGAGGSSSCARFRRPALLQTADSATAARKKPRTLAASRVRPAPRWLLDPPRPLDEVDTAAVSPGDRSSCFPCPSVSNRAGGRRTNPPDYFIAQR